jgi:hypothetical protein
VPGEQWHELLGIDAARQGSDKKSQVPGFMSYLNLLYRVTEIFEFAARISQKGIYSGGVWLEIQLNGIQGYILKMAPDRLWRMECAATENTLTRDWKLDSAELVSASADRSLGAAVWFLERFGWLSPAIEVIKKDQHEFLAGR